jgi:hypothetical protein
VRSPAARWSAQLSSPPSPLSGRRSIPLDTRPCTRPGTHLREHDDREQFLAGIDLILVGVETVNRAGKDGSAM